MRHSLRTGVGAVSPLPGEATPSTPPTDQDIEDAAVEAIVRNYRSYDLDDPPLHTLQQMRDDARGVIAAIRPMIRAQVLAELGAGS